MVAKWYEHLWPMSGVLSASLLIAWATEVLSFFLSRGLAFALLALLQVLPEFAVEAVITNSAAHDPQRLVYVTANFTGANRLIVGLFLPLVFFMASWRARQRGEVLRAVKLPVESSVEVVALIVPTLYSFLFVIRGNVGVGDAVLLIGMYATYLYIAFQLPPEHEEAEALPLVPRQIRRRPIPHQKLIVAAFFLMGGLLLFASVHPFYENTLELGVTLGISSYFLLQWIAPFLSEFPEFVTIAYWGKTGRAQLGLTNAISSKVNQWTLLIAMIPVVYLVTTWQLGRAAYYVPFDASQRLEILLTAAQGLFAAVCLVNLRFERWEAWTILLLWAVQLLDPLIDPQLPQHLPTLFGTGHYVREWTTAAYLGLTGLTLALRQDRFAAFSGFRQVVRTHLVRSGPKPAHR